MVLPIAEKVPILPQDAEKLVRINGAVMVGAGTLMALGKFRRLAAVALIGSIIPTTCAEYRFWEEEDEAARARKRNHFLKNLGLLGGLILEAFDTEGAPSLRWRAAHRGAKRGSSGAKRGSSGGKRSSGGGKQDSSSGNELAKRISGGIGAAQEMLSHATEASAPVIGQARDAVTGLPEKSNRAWKKAQERAAHVDIAQQKASLKETQAAMLRAAAMLRQADSYRVAATRAQQKAAKVDLANQQVALKEAQRMLRQAVTQGRVKTHPVVVQSASALKQARVNAQPVLASAAKTFKQARANAQPVLSSAASRAADAWSHRPVGT